MESRCPDRRQFPRYGGEYERQGIQQVLIHNLWKDKKETDKKYLPQERGAGNLVVGRVEENLSLDSQHSKTGTLRL